MGEAVWVKEGLTRGEGERHWTNDSPALEGPPPLPRSFSSLNAYFHRFA